MYGKYEVPSDAMKGFLFFYALECLNSMRLVDKLKFNLVSWSAAIRSAGEPVSTHGESHAESDSTPGRYSEDGDDLGHSTGFTDQHSLLHSNLGIHQRLDIAYIYSTHIGFSLGSSWHNRRHTSLPS